MRYFLEMLKSPKYYIPFILFFVFSISFLTIFNDSIHPLFTYDYLMSSSYDPTDKTSLYPTTQILDDFCKNCLTAKSAEKATPIGLPRPIKALNIPVLLMVYIGAITLNKDYSKNSFKPTKSILSNYFSKVFFTLIVFLVTLLGMILFGWSFFNFNAANNYIFVPNNFLALSFCSDYINEISIRLWQFELLKSFLFILEIFVFNAIGFLFSVAIKNRAVSISSIMIISIVFLFLSHYGMMSDLIFNPYSLTNLSNDLSTIKNFTNHFIKSITFMDTVISFTFYSIICIVLSINILKHRKSDI